MVIDYGILNGMKHDKETIAISKFKATCLAVLKRVQRTGRPVVVTRYGEPVAEVVPPPPPERGAGWLGALAGHGRVVGDIISPVVDESEWEATRS